ncbi:MAG: hypothetical protein QOG54_761 [Actinomycetota bacterium]|jgi:hypothetical protein|nr:hypothetical protein [Actinomycetota bacterium]
MICTLLISVSLSGCGSESTNEAAGDIVYVLPSNLPDGWTLRVATERPGPPASYSVSWAPEELAGATRDEAVNLPDKGPTLFINVGAPFYVDRYEREIPNLAGNAQEAAVTHEGEILEMHFLMDGSIVAVGARDVDENVVRSFATSLKAFARDEWRRTLGARLLVDPAPQQ